MGRVVIKCGARFIWGVLCFFSLLAPCGGYNSPSSPPDTSPAIYYIGTDGKDSNNGSASSPFGTFSKAVGILRAGDTLFIMSGTYRQSLLVSGKNGVSGSPITIKAVNDGEVFVDGQNVRIPCEVGDGSSYVTIEGIRCGNSSGDVFYIHGSGTHHISVRRVTAFNAANNNNHVFSLWKSRHVTLEDVAAYGNGRQSFNIMGADYTVVRRCFGLWQTYAGNGGPVGFMQIYGSSNCIVENCVGVWRGTSNMEGQQGLVIWANTYNRGANHNRIYGNVVMNYPGWAYGVSSAQNTITGNNFHHNASIDNGLGFQQTADDNLIVESLVVKGATDGFNMNTDSSYLRNYRTYNQGFVIKTARLRHSVFLQDVRALGWSSAAYGFRGVANTYNIYYGYNRDYYMNAVKGKGEKTLNPGYDPGRFGKGAYLMIPAALQGKGEGGADIGAEVLYRYQDGVLTNQPLWPWPMEDRIYRETGVSVTWAANGGLWKTLNGVYRAK